MPRDDLLNMTDQDLEGYSNRGTVKRAHKDLERIDDIRTTLTIDHEGNIEANWEDGVRTQLAAANTFPDGMCTCPASTTCRHLIALLLGYQQVAVNNGTDITKVVWNPGDIKDEEIKNHFPLAMIKKAKKQFNEGVLLELVIGEKPLAIIESIGVVIRFLVPGDPRYVQSDSNESITKISALIAIYAFRQLPKEKLTGYVSTCSIPTLKKDNPSYQIEDSFYHIMRNGLAHLNNQKIDRLKRAIIKLETLDWIWPAAHCSHIIDQVERYKNHDGSFAPSVVIRHMGEFLCRQTALKSVKLPFPEIIVRGGGQQRLNEKTGKSRFIGLGCRIKDVSGILLIEAFMQSTDTGAVVVLEKSIKQADQNEKQRSYHQLAQQSLIQKHSIYHYAKGQVLTSGAKRTIENRVTFSRNTIVNPQSFQWKNLRSNLLMDDFDELKARLDARPLGPFRSLKASENFYVLAIKSVDNARFNVASQMISADIVDANNTSIRLEYPFTTQGSQGAEALLQLLTRHGELIQFMSGTITEHMQSMAFEPVGVVYLHEQQSMLLQPFVDSALPQIESNHITAFDSLALSKSPTTLVLEELDDILSDIVMMGFDLCPIEIQSHWQTLLQQTTLLGMHQLQKLLSETINWEDTATVNQESLRQLLIYLRLSKHL